MLEQGHFTAGVRGALDALHRAMEQSGWAPRPDEELLHSLVASVAQARVAEDELRAQLVETRRSLTEREGEVAHQAALLEVYHSQRQADREVAASLRFEVDRLRAELAARGFASSFDPS